MLSIIVSDMERRDKIFALANVRRRPARSNRTKTASFATKKKEVPKRVERSDVIIGLVPPMDSSGSDVSSDESTFDVDQKRTAPKKSNARVVEVDNTNASLSIADVLDEDYTTDSDVSDTDQERKTSQLDASTSLQPVTIDSLQPQSSMLAPGSGLFMDIQSVIETGNEQDQSGDDFMLYSRLGIDEDLSFLNNRDSIRVGLQEPEISIQEQNVSNTSVCTSENVKSVPVSSNLRSKRARHSKLGKNQKNKKRLKRKAKAQVYNWKKEAFKSVVTNSITVESDDEQAVTIPTPLNYFLQLFPIFAFQLIVEQTNLYSCQRTGKSVDINIFEVQNFVGILIMMGIVCLPAYTDYWSKEFRYERIASVMSLKRFQAIRRNIHFMDNTEPVINTDRYFKVRNLLDIVRSNFLKIKEEGKYSIDEQMVPYKGKKAGSRKQYT